MARDSELWERAYKAYKKYPGKRSRKVREKPSRAVTKRKPPPLEKKLRVKVKHDRKPITLYALELEDGCYYVGISTNVARRLIQHKTGKGSLWTKLHKPIQVIEVRDAKTNTLSEAAKLEDEMTLEYASKYGRGKVRGGGYCQRRPRWPVVHEWSDIAIYERISVLQG